jgi:hypothetical protein
MKRQWLFILILMASAALLRLQIYTEQSQDEDSATSGQLTTLDPEVIRNIRIQRSSDTLVFNRQGETWLMTRPESIPADPERMTELRALAILDVLSSYDANTLDLSTKGLTPPQLTVWLNETRIDFGILNPANQRRYVLVEDRLNLIADNIYPILSAPAKTFIQDGQATTNKEVQ